MSLASLFLDIALAGILILFIWVAAKRGFVRALVEFVGTLAIIFVAVYLGRWISDVIFNTFIRDGMVKTVTEAIPAVGTDNMADAIAAAFAALPGYILQGAAIYGITPANIAGSVTTALPDSGSVAGAIVDVAVAPIVTALIQAILCIVIFTVGLFLVRRIAKLVNAAMKVPVLHGVNSFLGGALGFLKGSVVILLICGVLYLLAPSVSAVGDLLKPETLDKTLIFKYIYNGNPILALIGRI